MVERTDSVLSRDPWKQSAGKMLSKLYDVITSCDNVVHVALVTKNGQGTRFRPVHLKGDVLCIDNFWTRRFGWKEFFGGEGVQKG